MKMTAEVKGKLRVLWTRTTERLDEDFTSEDEVIYRLDELEALAHAAYALRDEEVANLTVDLKREQYLHNSYRMDIAAGCDISRGDKLYRQVEVVIGPGKTKDQLKVEELKQRLHLFEEDVK